MACFFHFPTIVGWMPCLVANCAVVSLPRSASSATFALNSAEYRFLLLVIQVRPSQERTELKPLSEFAAHLTDQRRCRCSLTFGCLRLNRISLLTRGTKLTVPEGSSIAAAPITCRTPAARHALITFSLPPCL